MNFIDHTAQVGEGTKVWHFAVILNDAIIGSNSSIGSLAEIGSGSVIGDNTRISHGVFLPSNSLIGDNVFIGPNVTFTDDRYPRAGNKKYRAEPPVVENGASIGAGSVILPGIRIGENAMIGAGSIVTKDVLPSAVIHGNAATYQRSLECLSQ